MMLVTSAIATGVTIGVVCLLKAVGAAPKLLTFIDTFKGSAESLMDILLPTIIAAVFVILGMILAGFIYQMTRNILYAVAPSLVLSFGGIVLVNRLREAISYLATTPALIEKEQERLRRAYAQVTKDTIQARIDKYEAGMIEAESSQLATYIFIGIFMVALLVLLGRCICAFVKTTKAASVDSGKKADMETKAEAEIVAETEATMNTEDALVLLKNELESGAITQEEYDAKRSDLIKNL